MTRLAHVSDLHFGRHDPLVAEALLEDLRAARVDLLLVSGDLTQRARRAQFRAARTWLDRVGPPWIAVPGNHDVPLFDVLRRFLAPLARWRRYVQSDLAPFFQNDEISLLGLNTARRNRWKEGRISREQMRLVHERLGTAGPDRLKVLMSHHPFLPPPADRSWVPMERAEAALAEFESLGLDLLLSGHQHVAYSADVQRHYEKVTRTILVVHAGTSISTRTRGEPNTWNRLVYVPPVLDLEVRTRNGRVFETTGRRRFERGPAGWRTLSGPDADESALSGRRAGS